MNGYHLFVCALLGITVFKNAEASQIMNFQRTLKEARDQESVLEPCDKRREDICDKTSEELYAGLSECQNTTCLYQPTVGLANHPYSPQFKYNPRAIVTSAKRIIYSFQGMEGAVCSVKAQPCSCETEEKCACKAAAKVCKQQYRVERTFFVVYNEPKKSHKSQYRKPIGIIQHGGHQAGFGQPQFGMPIASPIQSSFAQSYNSQSATGVPISGFYARSLTGKEQSDDSDSKRSLEYLPNPALSGQPGQQFNEQNSEMQKFQSLVQSLRMNQAPQGYPMGPMSFPQQNQGMGGFNPFQGAPLPQPMPVQPQNMYQQERPMPAQHQNMYRQSPPKIATYLPQQPKKEPMYSANANPTTFNGFQQNQYHHQPSRPVYNQYPNPNPQPYHAPYPSHHQGSTQQQHHSPSPPTSAPVYGQSMLTSAMFRYFLMQDKTTSTGNTFLKMLPILMSSKEMSKMISFESLYVMVPNGCACESTKEEKVDMEKPPTNHGFPFFNPSYPFFGMNPGFQMPQQQHNPFGPQSMMNLNLADPSNNMYPVPGHQNMPHPGAPGFGNQMPWNMQYQFMNGQTAPGFY